MRIKKDNTVGLLVDIQERLLPVMHKKDQLINNTQRLIKGLEELKIPTIFTQQYTKGLGETVEEISSQFQDFQYIEKRDFSCCDESAVEKKLNSLEAENVIICGIESHVCVLQTAIDLKEMGKNPIVVMNCISSRYEDDLKWAIERLRYENIMMTSYEAILFELTRSSKAEEFRAISKIVK